MPRSPTGRERGGETRLGEPRGLGSGTAASQNSRRGSLSILPFLSPLPGRGEEKGGPEKGSNHGLSSQVAVWIHSGPDGHRNGREERNLVLHRPWRGLGGVRRLGRSGGGRSRGCVTPSFAVAPYTVGVTTAFLFLLLTLS